MNILRLFPIIISFLLLAAHFVRAGQTVLALVSLFFLIPLVVKKPWVPRVTQLALLLGAAEWLRTLFFIAQMRIEFGMPWTRMAIILGAVTLFTALSGLVFRSGALRKRYSAEERTQ